MFNVNFQKYFILLNQFAKRNILFLTNESENRKSKNNLTSFLMLRQMVREQNKFANWHKLRA